MPHIPGAGFGPGWFSNGVTVLPNTTTAPAHERNREVCRQLERWTIREPRRYRTIDEAAAQMMCTTSGCLPNWRSTLRHLR